VKASLGSHGRLRALMGIAAYVSSQDKLNPPEIDPVPPELPEDDDRLQLDLRLGLDEVAAAEEKQLRREPRRRLGRGQLISLADKLYEARRSRDKVFSNALFGEPAWDMLLALYAYPTRGILLGVTSLSYAADCPPATGARWQKVLEEEGLIRRGPRVSDSRVQLVGLTDKGRHLMEKYLTRLYYCQSQDAPEID
jgi:DNA-binding MarR family transcriptional regulator